MRTSDFPLRLFLLPFIIFSAASACEDSDTEVPVDPTPTPDTSPDPTPVATPAPTPVPDDFRIPGLSADVKVGIDEVGVVHFDCQSDEDCAAAQGYISARHRLGQMELRRRLPRGRLSEIVGELGIPTDRASRSIFYTLDGRPVEEQLWENTSERDKALIEAYVRGVNAFIDDWKAGRNGATVARELTFPLIDQDAIGHWEPQDTIACVLALIDNLTNSSGTEAFYGELLAGLGPEALTALYGLTPATEGSILPATQVGFPIRSRLDPARLSQIRERLLPAQGVIAQARKALEAVFGDANQHELRGSNNWVVGPSRAAGDGALLANDPHLGMSHPGIWHPVHVDAKTNGSGSVHVAGAAFACLPGVLLGQNENIAWGATTTNFDQSDLYLETLNDDGTAVMFNGEWVPLLEVTDMIPVSGMDAPVSHTTKIVPHHGPIISMDLDAGTAISMRWTAQNGDTDTNLIYGLNTATSVEEVRTVLRDVTTVGQNWVTIDREGHIGWFPYNRIPARPWASLELAPWMPLPGDGTAEWGDWLPLEDLPQAMDPPAGYIITANNDMTGHLEDGDPTNDGTPPWQTFVETGYRFARIDELIQAGGTDQTRADMERIIGDTQVMVGRQLTPIWLTAVDGMALDEAGAQVKAALEAWAFDCPTGLMGTDPEMAPADPDATVTAESAGCAAFHVVWPRLLRSLGRVMRAAGPESLQGSLPTSNAFVQAQKRPENLPGGTEWWDDPETDGTESYGDAVAAAMESAGAWLRENLGASTGDWRWGRIHTLSLFADLYSSAGVPGFDAGPWANDGGFFSVDVASPSGTQSDNYGQAWGASMRFVCASGTDSLDCSLQLPGGTDHHRGERTFNINVERYLSNTPFDLNMDIDDGLAGAIESFLIQPAE